MRLRGIWQWVTPYQKLVIFVLFIFLFAFLFTAFSGVLIHFFFQINILTDPGALNNTDNPSVISALKVMQIVSSIGTFIIPPFLAGIVFSMQPFRFLSLDKKVPGYLIALVFSLVIVSMPLINQMMVWNEHLTFPAFLKGLEQWMQNSEEKAAELTRAFMSMSSFPDLILNLFMIALIPAIGEELIFRGVIQKLFRDLIKNSFIAILFTSILFSAIHLQFYGFLPRLMLGLILGYLLEWSGSLWLPIILHFLNNGLAVLLAYFYPEIPSDELGTNPGESWQVILSAVLTLSLIYSIFRYSKNQQHTKQPIEI